MIKVFVKMSLLTTVIVTGRYVISNRVTIGEVMRVNVINLAVEPRKLVLAF